VSREPGLWFSSLSIRIEEVRRAHKRQCASCPRVPEPGERRLVVKKGAGRAAEIFVYCESCGRVELHRMEQEAGNAKRYLATGEGEVRCL
jgi:uncharacterized Zn finger protein